MKKKVKKLELSKETLRNLEKGELGRVVGASDMCTTYFSYCPYICDMPETTFTACIA